MHVCALHPYECSMMLMYWFNVCNPRVELLTFLVSKDVKLEYDIKLFMQLACQDKMIASQ
jgi:hypothetical protein